MQEIDDTHRCYGQPPEIILCDFLSSTNRYGYGPKYEKLGIWLSDGKTIWTASDVSLHPTYHQSMGAAMAVAVELSKNNGWPIMFYSGGDGFATHDRILIESDIDIIETILKYE